ncbi:MAG: mechanosensitive ion channel [Ignavibacteriaceae bacterium]|nr:mechanosensitive ion channel [Ignavibacteriaceae bacterium]
MKTQPSSKLRILKSIQFFLIILYLLSLPFALDSYAFTSTDSIKTEENNLNVGQTTAAVKFEGKILFYVRGITSLPAEERARIIAERMNNIAENDSINTGSLRIEELEDRSNILAGENFIVSIVDADAAIEGLDRQLLSEIIKNNIAKAIDSYRYERSSGVLLKKVIYAAVATVVFLLLLFLFLRISRRLDNLVQAKLKSRIEGLETQSYHLIQAKQLWTALRGFINSIKILVIAILIFLYVQYVLKSFPLTKPLADELFSLILSPLGSLGMGFVSSLPNIIFLIVLFFVIRYLVKLIKLFFAGVSQGTISFANFDPEWALPTFKIVRFLIIILAFVIAYPYIPGSESDAFKGVSVLLGIMFSIGSSSFISNIIAGYSLTYRRAFKIGDRIKIDDSFGDVVDMKLYVTRLRSLKNEEIIIPNSSLINSNVINYSSLAKQHGLILHTTVGIGYETPWRLVEEMLKSAADRTQGLLKQPTPFVLQKSLGDFAITYEINAYCDSPNKMMLIYSSLHQNILDVFNENNIQIMTPAYEGDPAEPKVVPKEKWFPTPGTNKK